MGNVITAILIGAGNRGMEVYGNYALKFPDKLKFIAVAEPIQFRKEIILFDHFSGTKEEIFSKKLTIDSSGHGGGDFALIDAFLESIHNKKSQPLTNAYETLESHLMAFAANKSRLKAKIINMEKFRRIEEN